MDIVRLRSFCKVYELRSFSKAAKELFVSQPTVSSHILSLEEEFGQKLFDRIGKNIIPTIGGDTIYRYAKEILDLIYKAELEIKLIKNQVIGELKIGGSTIPGCYILPKVISKYCKAYPKVEVQLQIFDSEQVVGKVADGSLDVGITGAVFDREDLLFKKIVSDKLVFIGRSKYLNDISSPGDIRKVPWVIREKGSGTRRAVEGGLKMAGIELCQLDIKALVTNTQGLLSLVSSGIGISVTSFFAAQSLIKSHEDVVIREYPFFDFKRSFYLVYHRSRTMYPASKIFIDYICKASKELVRGFI